MTPVLTEPTSFCKHVPGSTFKEDKIFNLQQNLKKSFSLYSSDSCAYQAIEDYQEFYSVCFSMLKLKLLKTCPEWKTLPSSSTYSAAMLAPSL
jgi:hypothetical protein